MSYEEINNLLNKYSTKQPSERWNKKTNERFEKITRINDELRIFDGINSEYFKLIGSQKDRARYLIKKLNFNEICPRCKSEQLIVMICYFVKCEYDKRYGRDYCRKAFKEYKVSDYLIDRFMLFLARYGINNTILDKNIVLNL